MANTTQAASSGPFTASPVLSSIPINLLDSFLPGYSLLSKFLLDVTGFDVTLLVSTCFLGFAFFGAAKYIWDSIYEFWSTWFMSSVTIASDDIIYHHVMQWIEEQNIVRTSRHLNVKSRGGLAAESMFGMRGGRSKGPSPNLMDMYFGDSATTPLNGEKGLFNFSEWEAKIRMFYSFLSFHVN